MAHSIQDFKSTLIGGGARPNLFEVTLTNIPSNPDFSSEEFSILCKAAQLPASNIASIDIPFRGRTFKVAGDRTFDPWTVTIINDENFKIRKAMEQWMQFIGQYGDGSGATEPESYQVDAVVSQLARTASTTGVNNSVGGGLNRNISQGPNSGRVSAQYKFFGIFPTNISAIDLSYDSSDTIEEFTVEFQVQYWAPFEGEP